MSIPIIDENHHHVRMSLNAMSDEEVNLAYRILRYEYYRHETTDFWMDAFLIRLGSFRNCYGVWNQKEFDSFRLGNVYFLIIVDAITNVDNYYRREANDT